MKEPHVILRLRLDPAAASATRAVARRTRTTGVAAPPPEKIAVQVDELGDKEIETLGKDREVQAIAPIVPMKLIRPVSKKSAAASSGGGGGGTAWGVKAVKADASDLTGAGIKVAVLDTGIDKNHPAFAGVNLTQKNFTDDANPDDEDGHGTHCAGTIFGRDVGGTRIGIARGVSEALIGKVIGNTGGASDRIASAIQWALDNNAHVVSMSLGIDFPGLVKRWEEFGMDTEIAVSRALEGYRANVLLFERLAAFVRSLGAFGRPSIIVAAAGNESQREKKADFVIGVSPPAVSDGIISVAAVGQSAGGLDVAEFSNVGAPISPAPVSTSIPPPRGRLDWQARAARAWRHRMSQGLQRSGRNSSATQVRSPRSGLRRASSSRRRRPG